MSKLIKMTPECLEQCKKEFEEALMGGKFSDGKVSFIKTLGNIDRKASVCFTELAWLKMQTLIREFDKEVAWHGVAFRGEDETKDEYYITDILVYPQEVSGATVTTDQDKYQTWLMSHDDDVFNNIRMQGHSHVNMGVTPSAVDTTLYEKLLDQLDDEMFYIFMIWNKRKDRTVKIYDMKKNIFFDNVDVTVSVLNDGTGMEQFLKNAKEMVKEKTYSYGTTGAYGKTGYGAGGYNPPGYSYGRQGNSSQYGNTSGYSTPSGVSKKEESGLGKSKALAETKKTKKGRRKGKKNNRNTKQFRQMTVFDENDDYEELLRELGY